MSPFSLSYKRLLIIFSVIWITWSGLHQLALYYLGWSYSISCTDSLVSNLTLAAVCYATVNSLRYYTPGRSNWQNLIMYSGFLALVYIVAIHFCLKYFFADNEAYQVFLSKSMPIRFGLAFLMIGWVVLLVWLWRYIDAQKENE